MSALRRSAATLALAATSLLLAPAPAAFAHHGYSGPVRLYFDAVSVEPGADGWLMRAALHDSGNGKPAPGFVVHAAGTGSGGATFGPLTMTDGDTDGRYEADLGSLSTGDWTLTLDVADAPGATERAVPLKRNWAVSLQPGQAIDVLGQLPTPSEGGSSGSSGAVPSLLLGLVVAAGIGVSAVLFSRRRRTPVPVR